MKYLILALLGTIAYFYYKNYQKFKGITKPLKKANRIYLKWRTATQSEKEEMNAALNTAYLSLRSHISESERLLPIQNAAQNLAFQPRKLWLRLKCQILNRVRYKLKKQASRLFYLRGRSLLDKDRALGQRLLTCSLKIELLDEKPLKLIKKCTTLDELQMELPNEILAPFHFKEKAFKALSQDKSQLGYSLLALSDSYRDLEAFRQYQRYSQELDAFALQILKNTEAPLSHSLRLFSINCISEKAAHSAFTDLIDYRDHLFAAFREADQHEAGFNGSIRILKSRDGHSFEEAAFLSKESFDLRDPKFSIMPDGRLMLTLGGSVYREKKLISCNSLVAFSRDGTNWSPVQETNRYSEWIWRITWHENTGYGVSYKLDPKHPKREWILNLVKTLDGLKYETVTALAVPGFPSETTLRFLNDNTMVALVRRNGNSWLGSAKPPYANWTWKELNENIGGPNFLILDQKTFLASGRLYFQHPTELSLYYTGIGILSNFTYYPCLILPSGEDTSYPGLAIRDNILYVTYYSSHEGRSKIYLAKLVLDRR